MRYLCVGILLIMVIAGVTAARPILTTKPVYRAILVVSIGQQKLPRLSNKDPKDLLAQVRVLARSLLHGEVRGVREQVRGVRAVQAIWFKEFRDSRASGRATGRVWYEYRDADGRLVFRAPWEPYGALVTVEAESEGRLATYIEEVWRVARLVDQEMMRFAPVDDWE